MSRARILLADDHLMVAQGLGNLLKDEFDLVGIVGDGSALVEAVQEWQPDVVVADVAMPVLSGLDALRRLAADGIITRFVFLTMHADSQIATEAIRAGAFGYLLKHAAGDELITAIHEVLQGRVYLTPMITREVIAGLATPGVPAAQPPVKLTRRQVEVLRLIAQGRTMKEIAALLRLSRRTVESHKYEMMEALDLHTTAELVQYAMRQGLVSS
jgi:DNA-binding NarL/FixJ family response regulator